MAAALAPPLTVRVAPAAPTRTNARLPRWSTSPLNSLLLVIAYGPLVLSLATLILPVGGWLWQ